MVRILYVFNLMLPSKFNFYGKASQGILVEVRSRKTKLAHLLVEKLQCILWIAKDLFSHSFRPAKQKMSV